MNSSTLPRKTGLRPAVMVGLTVLIILGCRDKLTAPADCPSLCPGGEPPVEEQVVKADSGADSSFTGYIAAGLGPSLRISNGLAASEDRAIVVFLPRPDSVVVSDSTVHILRTDSVIITFTLQARDTNVTNLKFFLYRLPTNLDTTTTFADVDPLMTAGNLIDSVAVPDTMHAGLLRTVLTGADTLKVPRDSLGRLAVGFKITASAPTGVRIASIASTGSPSVITHVHADISDTTKQKQAITRFPQFASFVTQNPLAIDSTLLTVGGAPSTRSLIRFHLPSLIADSVTILRATLELTPTSPILGLPGDPGTLQAFGVIGDLGAKSPVVASSNLLGRIDLPSGTSGTVSVDVTRLIRQWQGTTGLPQLIFLAIAPEAATFSSPVFRSTRSGVGAPQLRITYFQKFPFERP